ncbi:unnamed protein product [Rhizophagus irregularis]|nr:unnamed protein product [Rhizophagus irregularis]
MGIYSPRVLIGLKVRTLLSSLCKTMVDIIVRTLLEDHDGPHNGGHYCPHITLLEDHDGPHNGGHYCPHITLLEDHNGPHHGGHYCPRIIGGP